MKNFLTKKLILTFYLFGLLSLAYAADPTITITSLSGNSSCLGTAATIVVNFNISANFNTHNKFTVQLSNSNGTWNGASNIGSINNSPTASPITATIPSNSAIGTSYKIRIKANQPNQTSNEVAFSILSTVTPTFTTISPICSGATLAALPTTSNNGITGTWSPALNNTATTIYTFTPSAGQCANTTTLTISVNPNITPTFTAVSTICSGATLAALPTTSNNGITGTWSPALNNTTTTIYTFTPSAGQCANTTTLTISVNQNITPIFTSIAPICSGSTLPTLPITSNNGITGTWSPALDNTTSTIYTFTPTNGQCATTASLSITVYQQPTVTLGVYFDVLLSTPEYTLSGGSPAGGTYSGTGVNLGKFNPAIAGVGTHTITYTY